MQTPSLFSLVLADCMLGISDGVSPLGVPETLCEPVRLARILRHGIVLVVGGVVDQRICLGDILGPECKDCSFSATNFAYRDS